jgi:heme/copper-type cytochrome/quinol oxidase subunit 4
MTEGPLEMASMFPMSAIQMRMKRNCEVNVLVAVVGIHAAFQCAMLLVAYLKSSEADTHDVHICGSVVVVVMGKVVLGSRMVCSDNESTAQWCDG